MQNDHGSKFTMGQHVNFISTQYNIIADSINDLQGILHMVNEASNNCGLKMNVSETKLLVTSKNPTNSLNFVIKNEALEHVSEYKCVGIWVSQNWDHFYKSLLKPLPKIKFRNQNGLLLYFLFSSVRHRNLTLSQALIRGTQGETDGRRSTS